MKTYTVTLNRAHKIVERLKADINELNIKCNPVGTFSFPLPIGINQHIDDAELEFKNNLEAIGNMNTLINMIRTLIGVMNGRVGISVKMTDMEYHASMINLLTQKVNAFKQAASKQEVNSQNSAYSSIAKDPVHHMQKIQYEGWARSNRMRLASDELMQSLEEQIEYHKKTNRRLTDEISDANRATIELNLDETVAEKLGLV